VPKCISGPIQSSGQSYSMKPWHSTGAGPTCSRIDTWNTAPPGPGPDIHLRIKKPHAEQASHRLSQKRSRPAEGWRLVMQSGASLQLKRQQQQCNQDIQQHVLNPRRSQHPVLRQCSLKRMLLKCMVDPRQYKTSNIALGSDPMSPKSYCRTKVALLSTAQPPLVSGAMPPALMP